MRRKFLWAAAVDAVLLAVAIGQQVMKQQAFMVWDNKDNLHPCVSELMMRDDVRLEAPMVDGKPDLKRAHLFGVQVTFEKECGHVEIRKIETQP